MTSENRRTLIIETIRAIRFGAPVSKAGVTLLLEASSSWRWVGLPKGRGSGMRLA